MFTKPALAQRPSQLILANGLRVRLLPQRASSQAAALVHVHAGAHDVPTDYPGLAHFLEHLLFLGSRGYRAVDSLMPYVQRCGGQLNASTRERHTDFFFQLPASHLTDALVRLLDMLANPLIDADAQLREREVLDAEFHARGRDADTLCDAALGLAIDAAHPFCAFHAGNRETLPVGEPAFQQALIGYHHRFYQTGQIELLLAGPQTIEQLLQLAELADATLASASRIPQPALSLRRKGSDWLRLQLDHAQPRLSLAFILDDLTEEASLALDYLSLWLASEANDGLAQRLREAGLCRSVKIRIPYWHEGQGVAVVELLPTERGLSERAALVEAVLDWLRFFSEDSHWEACFDEYQRARCRYLQSAEPLAQLRYWVEPLAWGADSADEGIRQAFVTLMSRMIGSAPVVLTADGSRCEAVASRGFPIRVASELPQQSIPVEWQWQPPARNPWLQLDVARKRASAMPPALRWHGPPDRSGQGALFTAWQFADEQHSTCMWHAYFQAIQSIAWAARQAGVSLRFEDFGRTWVLRLEGHAEVIPAIYADIIALFANLPEQVITEGRRHAHQQALRGDEMLLRQLLDYLPRLLALGRMPTGTTQSVNSADLSRLWRGARWHALAVGFADDMGGPLAEAIDTLPGSPVQSAIAPLTVARKRWYSIGSDGMSNETAVLVFCPLPNQTPECEAAWRVLAQLIEGAFFRRLRSELQLGYAVFSRFSQFGSHAGIVFGVQSPTASAGEILEHIETFLTGFSEQLAAQSTEFVIETRREASDRHIADRNDLYARANQVWQGLLSGHGVDHAIRVGAAMHALNLDDLAAALLELRSAAGGCTAIANAPKPNASWY